MVRLRGRNTAVAERPPAEDPDLPAGNVAVALAPPIARERPPVDRTLPGKRLGDLLVERGSVSGTDLQDALLEQTESGRRLGDVLLELGMIDEADLLQALSEQSSLAIVDLRRVDPVP